MEERNKNKKPVKEQLELKAEKEAINNKLKQQIQINQYSQGNNQFVQQIPR